MADGRLHQILLVEAEIAEPVFALSWLITWFAHDLQDPIQVCRLYDLYVPIYSSVYRDFRIHPPPSALIRVLRCIWCPRSDSSIADSWRWPTL